MSLKENDAAKYISIADSDPATAFIPTSIDEIESIDEDVNNQPITEGENEGTNEDEVGDEEEQEVSSSKYNLSTETSSGTQVVGDHAHVTINYYIEAIKESWQGNTSGNQSSLQKKYIDNLSLERENTFFLKDIKSPTSPLKDHVGISDWYYKLDTYEQCYVQATAIFHGAPAHEVSLKADSLYKQFHEHVEQSETIVNTAAQIEISPENIQRKTSFSDLSQQWKPDRELRTRTFTLTQRVNDVERLFWQDVDTYGLSNFGLHFLLFLAKEFVNRGEYGQNFLNIIENWAKQEKDDNSRQAAHAYGVILWHQNANQLCRTAELWLKANSKASQQRVAALLDGAYEIDLLLDRLRAENPKASVVLRQLDEWTTRVTYTKDAQEKLSTSQTQIGCTAASTYGLIGKRSPERALVGLGRLLELPKSQSTDNSNAIFATGVSAYVTLTWSGHIRLVLKFLAHNAELFSHQYKQPDKLRERQAYRQGREICLNATFEAFLLIAGTSILEAQSGSAAYYHLKGSLPLQPPVPDGNGRDVLLMGILLSDEDVWTDQLLTLLSALVIEQKSAPVFTLMHQWIDITLNMQNTQGGEAIEQSQLMQQRLVKFMVYLGRRIDEWLRYRLKQKQRAPQAYRAYKRKLEQWSKEGRLYHRPIGALADEVLQQLH